MIQKTYVNPETGEDVVVWGKDADKKYEEMGWTLDGVMLRDPETREEKREVNRLQKIIYKRRYGRT